MANTPHQLADEFPEHVGRIRQLQEADGHFRRMNRAIHRAEADIEPADDFRMTDMRKERMRLKDEIYGMLTRPEAVDNLP
ncbi:MAG TPA: YdcH family protein [Mycoplana sp.]|nr:YdcH family protein [Mycoplana sp.]